MGYDEKTAADRDDRGKGDGVFRPHIALVASDDRKPGAILDFDTVGDLVAIVILDVSRRASETTQVDLELIER